RADVLNNSVRVRRCKSMCLPSAQVCTLDLRLGRKSGPRPGKKSCLRGQRTEAEEALATRSSLCGAGPRGPRTYKFASRGEAENGQVGFAGRCWIEKLA